MKRGISVLLLSVSVCCAAIGEQAATAVAPPDVAPAPPVPGSAPDIPVAPPLTPPAPAFAGPCAYTPDVAARPAMRGFMSPARDMREDDFDTLQSWGATLLRFQMVRNWHATGANRDLEEFDRWLDGRLDHFDSFVLPQAVKRGMKVVLDLHVTPGGRNANWEMALFHDARFADHFVETWRHIAKRFAGREGIYAFDLINEPCHRGEALPDCDYWNLQRRAAEAVRAEDPHTPILVESQFWCSPEGFLTLVPFAHTNVIYEVHVYSPGSFTHQRIQGSRPWTLAWPDEERGWNRDWLAETLLKPVRDLQLRNGARIFVGEFSAVCWAPGAENYIADCIAIFNDYGWDWTFHAFREWAGWSIEREGEDNASFRPSDDNPRKRAVLAGLKGL